MKPKRVTIQMKAIQQYSHVFSLMIMVVQTSTSVDETQACDH